MNVVFLTMSRIVSISQRGIYTDLIRKFRDEGHVVFIVTPHERFLRRSTELLKRDGVHILGVKTLNLQKTNVIEKGIGQVLVENQYKRALKRYLPDIRFEMILYSTPPITFPKVIKYLRRKNPDAKTYLLLKDIFPQNAVDLGLMAKKGISSILYKYFRSKEKTLYALSDTIGCMSPANVDYILRHNPEISCDRVEVAPNSIDISVSWCRRDTDNAAIRRKYGLPTDRPVFIYGGNLGKPQGISFLIQCLEANSNRPDCYILIVGTGTELSRMKAWYDDNRPESVVVMNGLPKDEYDELVRACDVGMIILDHRFSIPNFPSRLLPYLENKMPVICATDPHTDIGRIAEENGFGLWCESNSVEAFTMILDKMILADRVAMGEKGYDFLCNNYLVSNTYEAIIKHV